MITFTQGIGLACTEEALSLGAEVMVTARSQSDVDTVCGSLGAKYPGKVHGCVADVSTPEGRATLVACVEKKWEALDVLVNNVGTNARKRIEEATEEDYRSMMTTNIDSAFFLCKALMQNLLRSGPF